MAVDVRVGFAQFDALATPYQVNVGFAQFDALAVPYQVNVGFAQFDALAVPFDVNVGFAQLDALSPGGGGYDDKKKHRKKVIVGGKLYKATVYELDQLLEIERSKQAQKALERAASDVIAIAKAKPAIQVVKAVASVTDAYDEEQEMEDLLMLML